MRLSEKINAIITENDWNQNLSTLCHEAGIDNPTILVNLQLYIEARLGQLEGLIKDVPDDEDETDLRAAMVYWYIEAKSQWCQFNQRLNYQMMTTGMPDQQLMGQGAIGTQLLEFVEALFPSNELEALTDLLASPVENAVELADLRTMQLRANHCEIPIELSKSLQYALVELQEFQFKLNGESTSGEVSREFEPLVHQAQSHLSQLNSLTFHEKVIRKQVQQLSMRNGLRILMKIDFGSGISLDTGIQIAILDVIRTWLDDMLINGVEESGAARIASGKAGYIDLRLALTTDKHFVKLSIIDDGVCMDDTESLNLLEVNPSYSGLGSAMSGLESVLSTSGCRLSVLQRGGIRQLEAIFIVPKMISARNYIIVSVGSHAYALSSDYVRTVTEYNSNSIHTKTTMPSLLIHGERHVAISLSDLLQIDQPTPEHGTCLSIQDNSPYIGLLVDSVLDYERGVTRPLGGKNFDIPPYVDGILHTKKGVRLVLDLEKLLGITDNQINHVA